MDNMSEQLLEKIDVLRERMDVTYKEAKEALDKAGGDLVEALVLLESEKGKWTEKIQSKGEEVLARLRGFFEKSSATKIRLKKDDRTLLELPATAGMLGLVGVLMSAELAVLGAIGTVAALLNRCTLEIERAGEGEVAGPAEEGTGLQG